MSNCTRRSWDNPEAEAIRGAKGVIRGAKGSMHLGSTELSDQHDQCIDRKCREASVMEVKYLEAVSQAAGTPVGFNEQLQVLLHVCGRGSRGRGL